MVINTLVITDQRSTPLNWTGEGKKETLFPLLRLLLDGQTSVSSSGGPLDYNTNPLGEESDQVTC